MATVIIDDNTVSLEGKVPSIIELESGNAVLLHTEPDTLLLKTYPNPSFLVTEFALFYRGASKITVYSFEDSNIRIEDQRLELTPQVLRSKLDRHLVPFLTILAIVSIVLFFLVLLSLALFAAGIATVIDAFTNGPFTYLQFYNLSSLALFLLVSVIVILLRLRQLQAIQVLYLLALYAIFVPAFGYLMQKHAARMNSG
jgi:hypothetical protein